MEQMGQMGARTAGRGMKRRWGTRDHRPGAFKTGLPLSEASYSYSYDWPQLTACAHRDTDSSNPRPRPRPSSPQPHRRSRGPRALARSTLGFSPTMSVASLTENSFAM